MRHGRLLPLLIVAAAAGTAPTLKATASAPVRFPLCFEANCGQAAQAVRFVARSRSGTMLLSPAETTVSLVGIETAPTPSLTRPTDGRRDRRVQCHTVSLQFIGANQRAVMTGLDALPGKANYLLGNAPDQWRTNVPLFSRVRVGAVYPGVDLVYYGTDRKLEYDFVVSPGADVRAIQMRVAGADRLELDAEGDLVLHIGSAQLRQHKPRLHQVIDGAARSVSGGYRMIDAQTVGFEVGRYDSKAPLIIDPILTYSSYFGGTGADAAFSTAVDATGNVYVTGETLSDLLPTSANAYQTNYLGGYPYGLGDAFVAKFSNTGSNLLYMTYLGGTGDDVALGITVDDVGNAYLTGATDSTNFPVTAGAIRSALTGTPSMIFALRPYDAFITKLNPTGSALIYSTYLGGDGYDEGIGIAIDAARSAYITGFTTSTNFTIYKPLPGQASLPGMTNAFVTKLTPAGTSLEYSTYLGGTNWDQGSGIAVDAAGRAFVTGATSSTNLPTVNPVQRCLAGEFDAFVSVLAADGQSIVTSTYLGGSAHDDGFRIALDAAGNAYVVGTEASTWTGAAAFPITPGNLNPGGVFMSTDAGVTWSAASAGLYATRVFSLAVDPIAPARIYAGTGRGVARSVNEGMNWNNTVVAEPSGSGLSPAITAGAITSVAVDPINPTRLYAGTLSGVYCSLDAGISWTLTSTGFAYYYPSTSVSALAVDPVTPGILYAGTSGYGVFWSTNAATNWSAIAYGLGSFNVFSLAVDPQAHTTLYAGTDAGVYRSDNQGALWNVFNKGLTNGYVLALAVNPLTPSTLYAGTAAGLFKSTNRGTNWTGLPLGVGFTNSMRVQAVAIDPLTSSTLYAGTTNGLFKSTDAGASWRIMTNGLSASFFGSLAVDPDNPVRVYAGATPLPGTETGDAFLIKLTNSAQAIQFSTVLGGTGTNAGWAVAVDAAGNSYIAGNTTATDFPTRDAFGALSPTNHGNNDVFVAAIDPDASRLLYSAYLGGAGEDFAYGLALDASRSAWIVGQTASTDFPTNNAFQPALGGGSGSDAFIAKISATPVLIATLAGSNLELKWPSSGLQLTLERTFSLPVPAGGWTVVPQTPVISNGWNKVTLPADGTSSFFHLRGP